MAKEFVVELEKNEEVTAKLVTEHNKNFNFDNSLAQDKSPITINHFNTKNIHVCLSPYPMILWNYSTLPAQFNFKWLSPTAKLQKVKMTPPTSFFQGFFLQFYAQILILALNETSQY